MFDDLKYMIVHNMRYSNIVH